jgi:hypothetical protein
MFGEPFSRVIRPEHLKRLKETKNSWWDEWIVCLCRPGEEPAEVLTDRFWVLYEAESVSQSEVEDLRMSFARDYGPAAQLLLKDVRRSIKDEGLDQYDGRIQKEETISIFGVNPSRYNPLTTTLLEREDVYPWVTGQEPRKFIGTIIQLAAMSKGVKLTQEEAYQAFMKIKNSVEN